jgi:hypothetical protein
MLGGEACVSANHRNANDRTHLYVLDTKYVLYVSTYKVTTNVILYDLTAVFGYFCRHRCRANRG